MKSTHSDAVASPFDILQGVSRTLLIPLFARAHAATLLPSLHYSDPSAQQCIAPFDTPIHEVSRDRFPMRLCVARSHFLDQAVSSLLKENSQRTVIVLACGLDTMPLRHASANASWICADLAPVMELRERLFSSNPNIRSTTLQLPDDIPTLLPHIHEEPPVIILEGILPYLPKEQVAQCFSLLAELCPQGADILVDSYHPKLLAFAEMGSTFKRMKTTFPFGLPHPKEYTSFSPRLRYLTHWNLLHVIPWYMRKRCWLPQLLTGKSPLATISHLSLTHESNP